MYLRSDIGFIYLQYYDLFLEWKRTDRISSNLITDSSPRAASCHTEVSYYEFHHYRFLWILWISSALSRSPEGSIIAHLTRPVYFLLFRVGQSIEVLAVFFYQYTSRQYNYSTVRRLILQKVQKMFNPEFIIQSTECITLSYSYLNWYNSRFYFFCVHFPLIEISRMKLLQGGWNVTPRAWNTYLVMYTNSWSYFSIHFLYLFFVLWIFMRLFCIRSGFVNSKSTLVWTGDPILVYCSIWTFR